MADKKKVGLGRGIGALIPTSSVPSERPIDVFFNAPGQPDAESAPAESGLVDIPGTRFGHLDVDSIVPNPQQPRSVFEPEAFAELVHSVTEFGVLQPIVVRSLGEQKYELIMGERRLRASKAAGLKKIPAVIRETADDNMLRDALLENIHRANLNPLEEASAYQQMLSDFGITQDQLATKIGRSRPQITNTIRLLKLPIAVQKKVAAGVLSAGHARALLSIEAPERMEALANKVINEGLSVRSLEELVALDRPENKKPGKATVTAGGRQDALKEFAEQLSDRLNTKVNIVLGKKKGQIQIDFATVGDLHRILAELNNKN
ncbi:ParB/RepB/Spo0J family partition protein [Rhodoluna sp.]|uniref:ParB/RepB/Spo0J family partition protein n=1 Tax=Rhodoluna sp. TaxID=1969481 RepID=UPI0025DCE204|nr:ParB/RepB/Spo0J family partition protein [Rhodoluna sp.]